MTTTDGPAPDNGGRPQGGHASPGGGSAVRYRALAVTASNRAAAGVYQDRGGPLIVAALAEWGFEVDGPRVVPDGDPVEQALRDAVADGYDAVLTTGGTGI